MSIREDLKAYIDGELSPERITEVEAALQVDADLRAEVEELRGLTLAVRSLAATPQPVGLEKTLSALRRRPWWSPAVPTGRLAWGAAAAAVIVVAFATLLPRGGIRDAATMTETASWTPAPAAERATGDDSTEAKSMQPEAAAAPAPESRYRAESDTDANMALPLESGAAATPGSLPATADKPMTQGASEPMLNMSDGVEVPANTNVRLYSANPRQTEAELLAIPGPLGGHATTVDGEVLLEIPKGRREDALRALRRVGAVVETADDKAEQAKRQAVPARQVPNPDDATVTITAKIEPGPSPTRSPQQETNGRGWVLTGLVGLALVALAGLGWTLMKRRA